MSIDYGHGQTNIDTETGIRFGVISQNSILQAWADSSEPHYGAPTCPNCGNEVKSIDDPAACDDIDPTTDQYRGGCADFYCSPCNHFLNSEYVYSDEPGTYVYEGDGYAMETCLDTDVMVLRSPFYTFAPFCSPCVPGAGNLDDAVSADVFAAMRGDKWMDPRSYPQTYCVGHDWFDGGVAPYPVFGVLSNAPCYPDAWYGHNVDMADGERFGVPWYFHAALQTPASAPVTDYCS